MIDVVLVIFIFALGTCVGSFLNVVIYRMPRDESIAWPPSHCPRCGRGIRWFDNIPIVSWLALRGRCRHCGARISPQYILVELLTGLMLVGLYAAYFLVQIRTLGAGAEDRVRAAELDILRAWPMFIAHGALLCGLLACAVVDWRHYIVPLPVMWTVALVGLVAAAFAPHPFGPSATATQTAMGLAAGAGLLCSLQAARMGLLTRSFLDVPDHPVGLQEPSGAAPAARHRLAGDAPASSRRARRRKRRRQRGAVGATAECGVSPRIEVLREVLFLLPAMTLAAGAWALLYHVPAARAWWAGWFDPSAHPALGPRLGGAGGALWAFLIGGAWIWGTRILATLAFGREAMGMGDVHILAGVGAVTGWVVPSLAFFVAPICGIVFALYLLLARRQRELPYGPWLAVGTVLVMLLYDVLVRFVEPLTTLFS